MSKSVILGVVFAMALPSSMVLASPKQIKGTFVGTLVAQADTSGKGKDGQADGKSSESTR